MRTRKQRNKVYPPRKMNHKQVRQTARHTIEVQVYGLDAQRKCVTAGVHWVHAITPRQLWLLATSWSRWRRWYDQLPENRNRDYPARGDEARLEWFGAFPIDRPNQATWIRMPRFV